MAERAPMRQKRRRVFIECELLSKNKKANAVTVSLKDVNGKTFTIQCNESLVEYREETGVNDSWNSDQFNEILNEIDESEPKSKHEEEKESKKKRNNWEIVSDIKSNSKFSQKEWDLITDKIREGNIEYITDLIEHYDIDVNNDIDPRWEETLLSKCAMAGQYNIAKLLLNYEAKLNPHPSLKGSNALKHAQKNSQYHVEQLLLLEQIGGGDASVDALNQIKKMLKQNGINKYMLKNIGDEFGASLIQYAMNVIQNKVSFSDDILMMAWNHVQNNKESDLYQCILGTCKQIISGNSKRDWYWLKTYMATSHLWYQPNPDADDEEEKSTADDHRIKVRHILLYDLFKIIEEESLHQSNKLRSVLLQSTTSAYWNELRNYTIPNNNERPRQDKISHGVRTEHSRTSLMKTVTPSVAFNAIKHHDLSDYLGRLMLTSHILNKSFQRDIRKIFNINVITMSNMPRNTIQYRSGPVKMPTRCRVKAETDYNASPFPTCAHVVDTIRCSLVFKDIEAFMDGLKAFINAIHPNETATNKYSITDILRLKNGFSAANEFDINQPKYADIKLNVRIEKKIENKTYAIIGEVQFLLDEMAAFKKKAHKLYGILRIEDKVINTLNIYELMKDIDKRIFVFGNLGDVNALCELMTSYNLSIKDLLYIDPKTKRSIVVNIMYLNNLKALQFLYKIDKDLVFDRLQYKSPKHFSPLDTAAKRGHLDVIKFVIQSYKDKYVSSEYIRDIASAFRNCCQCGKREVCLYIIQQFRDTGNEDKNIRFLLSFKDEYQNNESAVFSAAKSGQIDTIKWLFVTFDKWIDVLSLDKSNTSSFQIACKSGHVNVAKYILDQFQSKDEKLEVIHHKNNDGKNALDLAKDKNKEKIVADAIKAWNI